MRLTAGDRSGVKRRPMKYSMEQRLAIGRQIYERQINQAEAALIYDISMSTARDYMRLYKAEQKLGGAPAEPEQESGPLAGTRVTPPADPEPSSGAQADPAAPPDLAGMSREELIREILRLRQQR